MKFWAIPSWNGDIRFTPNGDESTLVSVVKPTLVETEAMKRFNKIAIKKGWTEVTNMHEKESIAVAAGFQLVGNEFLKLMKMKRKGVLTAVAFEGGKVQVTEVVDDDKLPVWAREKADDGASAMTTVKRPTLSCPECLGKSESDRAACDVLWEFLSESQRKEWLDRRAITVFGGLTGYCYRVCSRDTEMARRTGRITFDLTNRTVIHNYGYDRPPEEDVLTVKLLLEHRENWLRVYGEVDHVRDSLVFHNPMQLSDGFIRGY